jgi:hypothetical protein
MPGGKSRIDKGTITNKPERERRRDVYANKRVVVEDEPQSAQNNL